MNNLMNKSTTAKILSIALATMLWLYVITDQNPVIYKDVTAPVKLLNMDVLTESGLVMINTEPFVVTFKLKGNKNILDRVNENTVTVSADLKTVNEKGLVEVPVIVANVPIGVDMFWTSGSTIKLNVDNYVSRTMPIKIRILGNPMQGLLAMDPIINPRDVSINGAESIVDTINSLEVEVDITNLEGQVEKTLPITALDSQGSTVTGVELNPKEVDVIIPIKNTKLVPIEIDHEIKSAPGYIITSIAVSPKEVYIALDNDTFADISKISTERVELAGVNSYVEREISLVMPEGINLANRREKIILAINAEKIIDKTLETSIIEKINLDEDLNMNLHDTKIAARVRGLESRINTWDIDKAFYIDLDGLEEGTHKLPILYDRLDQIELLELSPRQITITLEKKE